MSLKKEPANKDLLCKVTFSLDKKDVHTAFRVNLTGEFNNWDTESIPMVKGKHGDYSVTVNLKKGKEYEFKYLIDGCGWLNEKDADKYVSNEFMNENSVVIV